MFQTYKFTHSQTHFNCSLNRNEYIISKHVPNVQIHAFEKHKLQMITLQINTLPCSKCIDHKFIPLYTEMNTNFNPPSALQTRMMISLFIYINDYIINIHVSNV